MVRFKNRWILVELIPLAPSTNLGASAQLEGPKMTTADGETNSKQIWTALKQSIIAHFGDTGWGAVAASLTIKYFSPHTNVCIIRVGRDQHRIAWAGVTLLTTVDGRRYVPNVIHVSGTIRHAQLAAIQHNREVIARYRTLAKTPVAYQDSYDEYLQTSTQEIEALQD